MEPYINRVARIVAPISIDDSGSDGIKNMLEIAIRMGSSFHKHSIVVQAWFNTPTTKHRTLLGFYKALFLKYKIYWHTICF